MARNQRNSLIALARRKQRQVEARLRALQSAYGSPLPTPFINDPKLIQLGRQIVEIEYALYAIDPELTVERLYPEPLVMDDYFRTW